METARIRVSDDTVLWLGLCIATVVAVAAFLGYLALHPTQAHEEESSEEEANVSPSALSGYAAYDQRFIRSDLDTGNDP